MIEDESYGYDNDYTSGGATHEHEEEEVEQEGRSLQGDTLNLDSMD